MTWRVVQWSTGNLGRAAIEGIIAHPDLELVGVWVHTASKAGKDAGEICGIGLTGVKTTQDAQSLIAMRPDCILYSPLFPDEDEVVRMLEAGINVVTPLNWFYTKHMKVDRLEAACRKGNAALHGTGIHPGGMTERIPLVISSFSQKITHVRAEEYSDCRTYGAPEVLRDYMFFGKPVEQARESMMLGVLSGGFYQSIDMIADELGFRLDPKKRAAHHAFPATAPVGSPIGIIRPGEIAAQKFTWQGTVNGEPVITASVNWYMGHDNIGGGWSSGGEDERYEVEIIGDPPITVQLHGIHPAKNYILAEVLRRNPGMVATANHCVSAVPYVCAATAGIKSYLDLPLVAGRARLDLSRHQKG